MLQFHRNKNDIMRHTLALLLLFLINKTTRLAHGTCVLESDFGFILNCNFKKTGLFRVRNLGGVKAHFGLGFSVGDELGFPESIGNLEGGRRRALNLKTGVPPATGIGVLPASRMPSPILSPVGPPQFIALPPKTQSTTTLMQKNVPSFKQRFPIIKNSQIPSTINVNGNKRSAPRSVPPPPSPSLMTEASSLPLGVPAFKPIPLKSKTSSNKTEKVTVQSNTSNIAINNRILKVSHNQQPSASFMRAVTKDNSYIHSLPAKSINQNLVSDPIPPFQKMPDHVSRISNTHNTYEIDTNNRGYSNIYPNDLPKIDLMGHTVEELAAAANVSAEAIRQAIYIKQMQLLAEYRAKQIKKELMRYSTTPASTTTTTTTTTIRTTTTPKPTKKQVMKSSNGSKVMNAPKEYYPVGYDKNFDDNFTSRVDLPHTTFNCGDQKHFPGLYADIDLGCMVFHVCALTDDGLIMKSFLCPESTLFDQTVLKCNWWFYVDCKSSKSLYDSNIPISKSYQLMKSLTYFSNYNKQNGDDKNGDMTIDIEALKNSVIIDKDYDSKNNKSDEWRIIVNDRQSRKKDQIEQESIKSKLTTNNSTLTKLPLENESHKNITSKIHSKNETYPAHRKSERRTTTTTTAPPLITSTTKILKNHILKNNSSIENHKQNETLTNILQIITTELKNEIIAENHVKVNITQKANSTNPS